MHILLRTLAAVLLVVLNGPVLALEKLPPVTPGQRRFVVTAYYSPLPDQCCYVRGSYEADKVLNGNGTHGASGAPVHPGMVAAPSNYPFGTRIDLPGIGIVTVEDRGGAINALSDGSDRLDLWVGSGEEGLARALAFGMQTIDGTVLDTDGAPSFAIDSLPSPWSRLLTFATTGDDVLLSLTAKRGERSASVYLLQQALKRAGTFHADPSGFFGPETERSLKRFQRIWGLPEDGGALSKLTAAYLIASQQPVDRTPIVASVGPSSPPSRIRDLQRTLRYLGFYRGRTHGIYDDTLMNAVVAFQKAQDILASQTTQGAGVAGPKTRQAITKAWQRKLVARRADEMLFLARIDEEVTKRGLIPSHFVKKGESGKDVALLQKILVANGFLPAHRATGFFGNETQAALIAFQKNRGIIASAADKGAGTAGPGTRAVFLRELRTALAAKVRGEGWDAL